MKRNLIPEYKKCNRCGELKHRFDFSVRTRGKSLRPRLRSRCRKCEAIDRKESRVANPERTKLYSTKGGLRVNHGISFIEYEEMILNQGGKCKICQTPQGIGRNRLFVDHNHTTKEIRGLLCNRCNFMIGLGLDDPSILRYAADYIETSKTGKLSRSSRGKGQPKLRGVSG